MSYRLKVDEPIAKGVSRIGLEQIGMAASRLVRRDDMAAAIHDTRRCLKRLRALLRLARSGLADSTYKREANRLAAIGRVLAGARDQYVMQETLQELNARFAGLPKRVAKQLTKLMVNRGRRRRLAPQLSGAPPGNGIPGARADILHARRK